LDLKLYNWQEEIVKTEGDLTIRGGRQVGKSEAVAERIVYLAKKYPACRILITSPSERQENFLFEKVKRVLGERYKYRKRPTLQHLWLANNTNIYKFPVGRTGVYVEGLSSIDFIFIDEAHNMTERAWDAILPMLAEPKKRGLGWITMLSNTRGKPEGTFYESFKETSNYKKIHISAEDCPHISKEFLEEEKKRIGESRYKMIWCGEFVEIDYRFFSKELIKRAIRLKTWTFAENYSAQRKYVIGIDPARFGKDKAGIVVGEIMSQEKIRIIHSEAIKKCSLVELMRIVENLDSRFHFSRFYIDGIGVGAGFVDFMKEKFKFKIIELNNSARGKDSLRLKEDLYSNTQRLFELDRIDLISDEKIKNSLESIDYDGEEFTGKETDITEALIRACWSMKEIIYTPKII
jgi:hypothetical protein